MADKRFYEIEDDFYKVIGGAMERYPRVDRVDVVIGIPFYNETDSLQEVIEAAQGSFPGEDIKKLIICVGDPAGEETLKTIEQKYSGEVMAFLMPQKAKGRGFSLRAILEISKIYDADVVLLEADLGRCGDRGIGPEWIKRLMVPVLGKYDVSVASFRRHPFEDTVGSLLVSPLISSLYGRRFADPLSGVYGISHDMVREICTEFDQCSIRAGGYGFNPWFIVFCIISGRHICEVNIGAKLSPMNFEKKHIVMRQMLSSLLDCVERDEIRHLTDGVITEGIDIYGEESRDLPLEIVCNSDEFHSEFVEGFYHYQKLLEEILGDGVFSQVKALVKSQKKGEVFSPELWAKMVYKFIVTYCTDESHQKGDIIELVIVAYNGVLASFLKATTHIKDVLDSSMPKSGLWLSAVTRELISEHNRCFLEQKADFQREFAESLRGKRLPLTPLDYLEFIPGVPIVLPKTLVGLGGKQVTTSKVFRRLEKRYEDSFGAFIEGLGVDVSMPSSKIIGAVEDLMGGLEDVIDSLCPGDLFTRDGTVQTVDGILDIFSKRKIKAIGERTLYKLLSEFPPNNLILKLGYSSSEEMLAREDIRKVMTLAGFTEDKDYFDKVYFWLQDNLRPDSFDMVELRALVIDRSEFQGLGQVRQISDLNRLTARIAVMNLNKGTGGKYAKLRYFTRLAKSIVEAEQFSQMVKTYARERKEVGRKFINSILGHFGKTVFSGHHIFENWHHREFVRRLEDLAERLGGQGDLRAKERIDAMIRGYGLSMVLNDGSFVPCSAWSWASFSFQGGKGTPTPMFLRVERDWFHHDLLEELYSDMGYRPKDIMNQVFQFISQGRESIDLAVALLGVKPHPEEVVVQDQSNWPRAGMLKRYVDNPILSPIGDNSWENRFVLNTAALNLEGKTYLFYRAFGEDKISRIGLAVMNQGRVLERLDYPVFSPVMEEEKYGCEDPRTVLIGEDIFMLYTAYDGVVAQIAAASISLKDFLNGEYEKWKRLGLAFPGLWDKDAILFPERIRGKYIIYHRIEPSIWIAYSDELSFPWPTTGHKIIMGPRSGMMWDSLKIGAGAQPIKTHYGWLLIYHGVDREMVYSLGVMLVDLDDPGKILYRSPNPILIPETECEIGSADKCWVPNVVFTCGAVAQSEKEILDDDDIILIYYGAADTDICLATGTVGEMIPKPVREKLKGKTAAMQTV